MRLWLATRFLMHQNPVGGRGRNRFDRLWPVIWARRIGLPAMLAIVGLSIGVASLAVAMAVVSGFESTLKGALIDVFGHVLVVKRGEEPLSFEKTESKLRGILPDVVGVTPFITLEAIVVGRGKLNGVVVQGVDAASVNSVLNLKTRLIRGEFKMGRLGGSASVSASGSEKPFALVGKALAQRFALNVGDSFRVVLPKPVSRDANGFSSTIADFQVSGVIDFGKAEYDERTVVTSIDEARQIGGMATGTFTGVRLKLQDADRAPQAALELNRALGNNWWIMDWSEGNRNLFRAVKYERAAIFLVILIMVIAASFNVATNIFIGVLRRTPEVAILRALGFKKGDVQKLFQMQGAVFGLVGVVAGNVLGLILAGLFVWAQRTFAFLPAQVYKLNEIGVDYRLSDVATVSFSAIAICLLASIVPAMRAARLDPVEGLRHE